MLEMLYNIEIYFKRYFVSEFIDTVRNDGNSSLVTGNTLISTNVPKDATVAELTSNTIWFLEHLYEYYEIIGSILQHDSVYNNPLQQLLQNKQLNADQRNKALLGIYISKMKLLFKDTFN